MSFRPGRPAPARQIVVSTLPISPSRCDDDIIRI